MSANIKHIHTDGLQKVTPVADFARRYGLPKDEENRLVKLFGSFATKSELLMNARREPTFR